jgi:hypothetical protein
VASLTESTPLYSAVGTLGPTTVSYAALHQRLTTNVSGFTDKYDKFIIEYTLEWDKVLSSRVAAGLKATEDLRRDLDHYQKKVEELRVQANKILVKGKMVDEKTAEKLKRNEEKLTQAKEVYHKSSRDMCILLEETTDRAWKDLHPVLVKMAQFDMTLANEEAKGLAEMETVVKSLKDIASSHELKATGRLKELGTQDPSLLYTGSNSGTVALTNGDVSSQLEGMSLRNSYDEPSLPPGSVAPQGMGGFPVQIREPSSPVETKSTLSEENGGSGSMSDMTSWQNPSVNAPTTVEMLSISAAPPPTIEEINDIRGFNRYDSYDTINSYGVSPMRQMAPPPPFSSPPPPPPFSSPPHPPPFSSPPHPPPFSSPPPPPPYMSPPPMQSYPDYYGSQHNLNTTPTGGNDPSANPSYGGPPNHPSYANHYYGGPSSYGLPTTMPPNPNAFGHSPGGYSSTNPYAY